MTEQRPESDLEGRPEDVREDGEDESQTDRHSEPEPDAFDEQAGLTPKTGHPAVDEVLRSLDDLDGRPVDEHVAAFEKAHDELRRALSSANDDQD